MTKKQDKQKENIINHIDCINQMDKLHEKLKSYDECLVERDSRIKELEEMFEASQDTNKSLFDRNIELNEQIQKLEDKVSNLEMKYKEIEIEKDKYKIKTKRFVTRLKELDIIEEDKFLDFIGKYRNDINENKVIYEPIDIKSSNEYINLRKNNDDMKIQIEELNIKLNSFPNDKIKEAIDIELEKQKIKHNEEINIYKNNIQKLEHNLNKINTGIPTPSNSSENKIDNDDILIDKIKCKKCNKLTKPLKNKKVELCYKCNKENQGNDFINNFKVFDEPNKNEIGYNSKILAAEETYIKLNYLNSLFITAKDDGIDITNLKELIDYIKENKLIDDKQYNIIKFKILRASSLISLFNNNKYVYIQNYIKRINFKIKDIAKLLPEQWNQFRVFIEKYLDKQLENIKEKDYPCKNDICEETVNVEGIFCNDCRENLKICKGCKKEFCMDDEDIKYCEDCGYHDDNNSGSDSD